MIQTLGTRNSHHVAMAAMLLLEGIDTIDNLIICLHTELICQLVFFAVGAHPF